MKILRLSIGTCMIVILWKLLEEVFHGEVQYGTVDSGMAVVWIVEVAVVWIVTVVIAYWGGIYSELKFWDREIWGQYKTNEKLSMYEIRIDELNEDNEALREILALAMKDIKHMDNCTTCQHQDSDPDCDCECDKCMSETCVCVKCSNDENWRWKHADQFDCVLGVVSQ